MFARLYTEETPRMIPTRALSKGKQEKKKWKKLSFNLFYNFDRKKWNEVHCQAGRTGHFVTKSSLHIDKCDYIHIIE